VPLSCHAYSSEVQQPAPTRSPQSPKDGYGSHDELLEWQRIGSPGQVLAMLGYAPSKRSLAYWN
jgi:hypothetical protein